MWVHGWIGAALGYGGAVSAVEDLPFYIREEMEIGGGGVGAFTLLLRQTMMLAATARYFMLGSVGLDLVWEMDGWVMSEPVLMSDS